MPSRTSPRCNILPGLARRCCYKALSGSASIGFVGPGRTYHGFLLRPPPAESSALIGKLITPIIWTLVAPNSSRMKARQASDLFKRLVQTQIWNPTTSSRGHSLTSYSHHHRRQIAMLICHGFQNILSLCYDQIRQTPPKFRVHALHSWSQGKRGREQA